MNQDTQYIFVHGLSGWGSYDERYEKMPYWGMHGGDLMQYLKAQGYACHAASVAPTGSAWDRACELYAQLAGKRVDYGEAHSREYRHERFGRDFSGQPLIEGWGPETRLVLLGHSFGGATVRLFAELMANGDPEEQSAGTSDISELFMGGLADRILSIVTIAARPTGPRHMTCLQTRRFILKTFACHGGAGSWPSRCPRKQSRRWMGVMRGIMPDTTCTSTGLLL